MAIPCRMALVAASALVILAGCSVVQGPEQKVADASADFSAQNVAAALAALKTAVQNQDASTYLTAGLVVANVECAQYFDSLGKAERHLQFARQENGIIAATTAAAMGLARATPVSIAGAALGFGLIDASLGAFQTNYIYAPDVAAIQTMVTTAQGQYLATMTAHPATTLQDAVNYALAYEAICQAQNIRHLVNDAVANAKFDATFTSGVPSGDPTMILVANLQQALAATTPLTDDDVGSLYWLFFLATTDQERQKAAKSFQSGNNASVNFCALIANIGSTPPGGPSCASIKTDVWAIANLDVAVKQKAAQQQTTASGTVQPSQAGQGSPAAHFLVLQHPQSVLQVPTSPAGRITVKVAP